MREIPTNFEQKIIKFRFVARRLELADVEFKRKNFKYELEEVRFDGFLETTMEQSKKQNFCH